ncbi:MAG: GntR domain protein [Paenibacillus sp.]|uniref:GntR family transcriptional regulator n=1 Tax=Paenibacillus hemerocallicola TaxID=1172614 RepID=A0A5C4SZB1_9BACL|nr:GntR family transcriptional regulator [Paenibacillus hemerocallicola]MDF2661935.1 GntR domain protein [Paenibacillus sp.]TNJ62124.1 GntR family transcriptional regulator [Paenibacillus hemerocallicola]
MTNSSKVTAYTQVKEWIKESILSGEIPAGSRITIAEIVQKYGVSQMPVREAFQILQGEGFIELLPHKGARVLSLTPQYVANIYEIRGVVEGLLARQSMPNLTLSGLNRLKELNRQMKSMIGEGVLPEELVKLDRQFHLEIYENSNNPEGMQIYEKYVGLIGSLRKKHGYGSERLADMISQHGQMIDAMQNQDAEALVQVVHAHSEGAKMDLLNAMER